MNDKLKIAVAGAALGFLGAVGIYFVPEEPYPGYITVAGTLSGITIALLITTVVTGTTSLFRSICGGCSHHPPCSWPRAAGRAGMPPSSCPPAS